MAQHISRGAAKGQLDEPGVPVRSHDQQVGVLLVRDLFDLLPRIGGERHRHHIGLNAMSRQMRDELHMRLMTWDPIIEQWEMLDPVRGADAEAAIKELYRFVARHFPQQQNWRIAR